MGEKSSGEDTGADTQRGESEGVRHTDSSEMSQMSLTP